MHLQNLSERFDKIELLHLAASSGSYRCFQELYYSFNKGDLAEINNKEHILVSTMKGGNSLIISLLLQGNRDTNIKLDTDNNSIGHLAVKYGFVSKLKLLNENGVNFNIQNNQGFTPYHLAILQDDKEMLEAFTKLIDKENWPKDLYSFAIIKGSNKCSQFLQEKNYKGIEYTTNLDISKINEFCINDDVAKAKELLNIYNIKNLEYYLNKAITYGNIKLVELMLEHGANFKAKVEGYDAYAWAIKNKNIEIIKLFNEMDLSAKLENDKSYYTTLTDNEYVKWAILEQYQQIDNVGNNLLKALKKNNFSAIKTVLNSFPVNNVLVKGENGGKPFLHYLFTKIGTSSEIFINKVLSQFYQNFDPNVKDNENNGLIHTLITSHLENLTARITLLYKYFASHMTQLLQQKDSNGQQAIEKAIKLKSQLPFILINKKLINVNELVKDQVIIQKLIESGDKELIKLFIEQGININHKDDNGKTLLMIASASNLLSVVKLLVANGADIEAIDLKHNKALHIAIENKNIEVALYLANISQVLEHKNREGHDPLMIAASNNLLPIISYFKDDVSAKKLFNEDGYNALHIASLLGHIEAITSLLDIGFDINRGSKQVGEEKYHNSTPLHLAMLNRKQETAAFLIRCGASLEVEDSIGDNAFEYGARCKDEHMVYFMKTLNGFYNEDNQRKMMLASVQCDNVNMVRELYLNGALLDICNKSGFNLLHIASQAGATKAINFILEQGIGVDLVSPNGNTALHFAATSGNASIMMPLLAAGANINLPDSAGKTALFMAAEKGHYSAVLQLLKAKADFCVRDQGNITPAQIALSSNHIDIAKLFFIMGDRSLTSSRNDLIPTYVLKEMQKHAALISELKNFEQEAKASNQNPLFLAARLNHSDAVKLLITLHPDYLTQRNLLGKTVIDYAPKEIKPLLVNHNSEDSKAKNIIPLSSKAVTSSDLAARLELISIELIKDVQDKSLIPSLVNLLSKLPVLSVMQFIKGLNEIGVTSREIYAQNCLDLLKLCTNNKEWMSKTNEAFLRPYQWNCLLDSQLLNVIGAVKKIDNNNLTKWFFSFLTPVEAHFTTKEQLGTAIKTFKIFIDNFNPNLSDVPSTNISFEVGGIEYLERANWLIEHSSNKNVQAKFLNKLPAAEGLTALSIPNSHNNVLPLITKDMFVGNILCCSKDVSKVHDYSVLKANLLYNSSSSELAILKQQNSLQR